MIDNNIIIIPHTIIWTLKGGEKYISVIMASETIKILKIKIAKNIGPSPQS
jgi:hypothetical protein